MSIYGNSLNGLTLKIASYNDRVTAYRKTNEYQFTTVAVIYTFTFISIFI